MSNTTLLELLATGDICSGQDLARAAGVSRTAIWKQINRLTEDYGVRVETVRGRGYRIPGGLDLLSESGIRSNTSAAARELMSAIALHMNLDSTSSETLRRAQENDAQCGFVCTTERQTAGRGRRGREWVSPFARNLYVSVLWNFHAGAAALEGLSLAVGVAVAEALDAAGLPGARLKWPNDILYDGAKMGGVLLEMSGDAAGPCQVVVGVGLNVAMDADTADGIDQAWTDARTAGLPDYCSRDALLGTLLSHLLPMLADFADAGFAASREAWLTRDAFPDASVVLDTGASRLAGTARGVDERGALILETTTGRQSVFGGEISLRPVE